MTYSLNNHVMVEKYVKEGLKAQITGGIAMPGQRDGLKGLRVLADAILNDGKKIPKDSIIYVREETLHTQPWATKLYSCNAISEKFMIVDAPYIELIETPDSA